MNSESEIINSKFIHTKWRLLRPYIRDIHSLADVVADPYLRHQILSTVEPSVDFAAICRREDPEYFSFLADLMMPEPAELSPLELSTYPGLTEKTASIAYYWLRMRRAFSQLNPGPVVEIGGGLGILARIMLQFSPATEYHIIDIPEMPHVQRQYFDACRVDISRVHFHNVLDQSLLSHDWRAEKYMLTLSTWGLSETTGCFREWIADNIARRSSAIYLVGQSVFHKQQVEEHLGQLLRPTFSLDSRPFIYSEPDFPSFELAGENRGAAQ